MCRHACYTGWVDTCVKEWVCESVCTGVVTERIVSASMYLPSRRLFRSSHRRWCHLPPGRVSVCLFGHACVTLLSVVCLRVSHPTQRSGLIRACQHAHAHVPVTARTEGVREVPVLPLPPCARIRVRAVVYLSAWVCPGVCRRVQGEGQSLGPVPAPASGGSGRTSWGAGTPLQLGEEPAGGERKGCAGVIDATVEGMDVLVTQNGVCGCARERGLRRSSGALRGPDPPQQARPARGPRASPRRTRGKRDPSPAARGPRAVSDTRRRQRLYFSRLEPRPRARDGPHGDADSAAAIFPISPESIIRRD